MTVCLGARTIHTDDAWIGSIDHFEFYSAFVGAADADAIYEGTYTNTDYLLFRVPFSSGSMADNTPNGPCTLGGVRGQRHSRPSDAPLFGGCLAHPLSFLACACAAHSEFRIPRRYGCFLGRPRSQRPMFAT
jgi:hypothetical protein